MCSLTTVLRCVSVASLLSACAAPYGGYYDANGDYVAYENKETRDYEPTPGGHNNPRYDDSRPTYTTTTIYADDHPGHYDYYGNYIPEDETFEIPPDMYPPHGMCRVWFMNRLPDHQPPVESCVDIRARTPAGAYVVYGD